FPPDNISEKLQKSITVLKSGEILPETVDLMTSSIEAVIAQEDESNDVIYSERVRALYPDRFRTFEYWHQSFPYYYYQCY
ncbi:MAG: hypothetical protein NUV86_03895, partial [Candidatus Scalindua sp.]|nr:hypothetical protein [Candidatus Scalindua sp.]